MSTQSKVGWFVLVVVGAMLLAACSRATTPPATSGTLQEASKPYGSLTIAAEFSGGVLDPQDDNGSVYQFLGNVFLESLIRQAPDGRLVANLAERWEISADGKSHTFYIRKGVNFHDGSDLTGADVKFSIERMMAPESVAATAKVWRSAIASVDLKDDYTVILRMKGPEFELLSDVESYASVVMPKKYIEEKGVDAWRKTLVGSGPFKVVKYEHGTRLELEAVESHWRAVPQFKNVTFMSVPEEGTRVSMLKTGELDIAGISIDSVATVEAAGLRVMSWDAGGIIFGFFYFNVDNPKDHPVGDRRVRKALILAMNRQEIVDKLFMGKGSPSIMFPLGPSEEFFDPNVLKLDPYDPEQAKKLVAEAGYPNGFDMRIYDIVSGSNALHMLNQALPGYWRQIGARVRLEAIDYGAFNRLTNPKHDPKVWNSIWTFPSALKRGFGRVAVLFHSQKATTPKIKNPRLDEMLDKAAGTANLDDRKRLMLEATAMAKDEYSSTGIVNLYENLALGPKVGEATPYWGRMIGLMAGTTTHAK